MMIPDYTDFLSWAASLIIDLPNDNIPDVSNSVEWKEWGDRLVQENSFLVAGSPSTDGFSDWRSWARVVYFTMVNN